MDVAAADSPPVDLPLERVRLAKGEVVPGTPYRIEEWIAEGGMGVVYRARHVDIDRVVALKVILGSEDDAGAIEQLRDEARVTARIAAPNIVEVYDFLRIPDGRVAMAMEMLEGQTLREALRASSMLPPGRAIGILRQICRGLAAAHEAGLVHLDIKPENIMLCPRQGRTDFVKVLDFGIASALGEVGREDVVGTAAYLAPERLGDEALDGRTDFYSLGCVAYEMLVGKPPFGGDLSAVMQHHLDTPAPSPVTSNQEIPAQLDALVVQCMAKAPSERPRDAADLEAALCEAQIAAGLRTAWDDLPLPAVAPERREYLKTHMPQPEGVGPRSPRRAWWAAAALGVVVAGGVMVAWRDDGSSMAAQQQSRIEELTTRAYAAAAKTFYLYPPADDPKADTAYTVLLDLDALEPEVVAASERAATLRHEFADALVRLGDRYWDELGGRAFAMDYYAQALMFDPTRERASERAMLSVGQINDLRRKAGERSFTAATLLSVEPLVALAMEDDQQRDQALEQLAAEPERSPRVRDDLTRLVERPGRTRTRRSSGAAGEPRSSSSPSDGGETGESAGAPAVEPAQSNAEVARQLVAQAKSQARAGRTRQAQTLFNRALKADPQSLEALVGLGDLHFEAGHYTEAARHRRAAIRRAPNNAKLRIGLGDALLKTFRYADAMVQYQRAAKLGHPSAASRITRLNERMGHR